MPRRRTRRRIDTVGQFRGDPEPAFLALDHELNAFGPALDDLIEGEAWRVRRERDGGIEHLAVGGPARVVHQSRCRSALGFLSPVALLRTLGGEAGIGLGGICRERRRHLQAPEAAWGHFKMPSSSTSKHEHACGASAAGIVAVGEFRWNPEAALLAFDHQLKTFGPALDHAVEGEAWRGVHA